MSNGGAPHHGRAPRQDRDVVEDGDLKAIPIQLPTLASPEGRDASLEAGDWLLQLEPLIQIMRQAGGGGEWRRPHRRMLGGYMLILSPG